jgi:hypothetical protein
MPPNRNELSVLRSAVGSWPLPTHLIHSIYQEKGFDKLSLVPWVDLLDIIRYL